MAENNIMPDGCCDNGFKEAVCIETARIYDSCSAKDCFEDLQVYFTDTAQGIIDAAMSVKSKKASVLNVFMDVEPVAFNKGFYSVDVTFFFKVVVEAFTSPISAPTEVTGLAVFTKKVILYGREGNVATYATDSTVINRYDYCGNNLPTASIQVVEPIFLAVKMCDRNEMCYEPCISIPPAVAAEFEGNFCTVTPTKNVYVTLGLSSIVNLQRKVQLLVPAYDYCIPEKECCCNTEDPCEIFRSIKFPVEEFFPPKMCNDDDTPPCDCEC